MTNTLTQNSNDNSLNVASFSGEAVNPADYKDIGQDLEVTSNDFIGQLPVEAGAEYEYSYQLIITRKKL